jgi:hypothetical protein
MHKDFNYCSLYILCICLTKVDWVFFFFFLNALFCYSMSMNNLLLCKGANDHFYALYNIFIIYLEELLDYSLLSLVVYSESADILWAV